MAILLAAQNVVQVDTKSLSLYVSRHVDDGRQLLVKVRGQLLRGWNTLTEELLEGQAFYVATPLMSAAVELQRRYGA